MLKKTPQSLFEIAAEKQSIIGAFNIFNLDTLTAVLDAAQECNAPVIIQVSMGARRYISSLPLFVKTIELYANSYDIPVALQHDHCSSLTACKEAVEAGFRAVMFDGSHLPYDENVSMTKEAAQLLHRAGGWLEAEIGQLPGFEDEIFAEHVQYTTPIAASAFIESTNCDALAVSIGTSHGGVRGDSYLQLDFDRLKAIHQKVGEYPLVLHGAASLPEELIHAVNKQGAKVPIVRNAPENQIASTAKYGIRKANMDVDNFLCYTTGIRETLNLLPEKYDPRVYLKPAQEAFRAEVIHKMRNVLGWQ